MELPQRKPSLQKRIDALSAGSELKLGSGEFRESITLHRPLTLIGAGPSTLVQAQRGHGPALRIASPGVCVQNLSIEHLDPASAAIHADAGSAASLERVKVFAGHIVGLDVIRDPEDPRSVRSVPPPALPLPSNPTISYVSMPPVVPTQRTGKQLVWALALAAALGLIYLIVPDHVEEVPEPIPIPGDGDHHPTPPEPDPKPAPPPAPPEPKSLEALLDEAEPLRQQEDQLEAALAKYREALSRYPTSTRASAYAAYCLYRLARMPEADTQADAALQNDSTQDSESEDKKAKALAVAHFVKGRVAEDRSDWSSARAHFTQALSFNPKSEWALNGRNDLLVYLEPANYLLSVLRVALRGEPLTDAMIAPLSLVGLRLLRNATLIRHGADLHDAGIHRLFYSPRAAELLGIELTIAPDRSLDSIRTAFMNDVDNRNADLVKGRQAELKGTAAGPNRFEIITATAPPFQAERDPRPERIERERPPDPSEVEPEPEVADVPCHIRCGLEHGRNAELTKQCQDLCP